MVRDYLSQGQGVKLSRDTLSPLLNISSVAERTKTPAKYKQQFCQRIALARDAAHYTQETMGKALGIGRDRYAKYETRSIMPPHLLVEFCKLTEHDPWYLLTGQPPSKAPGRGSSHRDAA